MHLDVLHVCYRGFGPDYVASCLLEIFKANQLGQAHDLACLWAKKDGQGLACDDLAIAMEQHFPTLQAKGMDIKLLILWLASCLLKRNNMLFSLNPFSL